MRFRRPIPVLLLATTFVLASRALAQFEGPPPDANPIQAPILPQPTNNSSLVRLRGDQSLTTNALIGFINSEPIFVLDLLRPIDDDLQRLSRTSRTLTDFRERASDLIAKELDSQKTDILIVDAAKASLTEQDQTAIDVYLAKARSSLLSKYGGSLAAADKALGATGSSVTKEIATARREVTRQLYVQKNLLPRVIVTGKMVTDAYEKNMSKWKQQAHLELFTITLPVYRWLPQKPTTDGSIGDPIDHPTPAQVKSAEAQATATGEEIVAKLHQGADFARLVEDYKSQDFARDKGGRTPSVSRGDLPLKQLEQYVFSLPANTIGIPQLIQDKDPQQSRVVVVKVGEKVDDHTISFMDAQPGIVKELRDKQIQDLEHETLSKLDAGSATEALDRNLYLAVDVAVARYATR